MSEQTTTSAEIAQASLDALDAERDALRARVSEAIDSVLNKPNGFAYRGTLPDALMPVIDAEANASALRLTEGYEIQYRQDQTALMDAGDREDDLKGRLAEEEARNARLDEDLAALTRERDAAAVLVCSDDRHQARIRSLETQLATAQTRLAGSVTIHPDYRAGHACIGASRVPAHIIAGLVPDVGEEGIADFYPTVTPAGARAAVKFAELYRERDEDEAAKWDARLADTKRGRDYWKQRHAELEEQLGAATHFLIGCIRIGYRRRYSDWEVWGDPALGGYEVAPKPEHHPTRDAALARARRLATDAHPTTEEATQ